MGKGKKILASKKPPVEASEELFSSGEEEEEDATQMEGDQEDSQPFEEEESQVIVEDSQVPEEHTPSPILHPPKKRQRHYHMIGEEHEVGVVDWYRKNELLYNKKMRAYRDRDKKNQTWSIKAAELGVDGEFIKLISNLNLFLIQNFSFNIYT